MRKLHQNVTVGLDPVVYASSVLSYYKNKSRFVKRRHSKLKTNPTSKS